MTKKELLNLLEPYNDNMEIFLDERNTDFKYGLLNSVSKVMVNFSEDEDGQILASDECIILSEQ